MAKKTIKKVNKPKAKDRPATQGKGQPARTGGREGSRPQARKDSNRPDASAGAGGSEPPKRRLGIRGAAPWAARHAAKHAAEARARAAVPPPPGSARATIRVPTGAEEIKVKIGLLQNAIGEIRALRKNLAHNFYSIGLVLQDVQVRKLYEARGFGTFEAFLDREIDLGKTTSMRLVRMVELFKKEGAMEYGLEKLMYVLSLLEGPEQAAAAPAAAQSTKPALPLRPPVPVKK